MGRVLDQDESDAFGIWKKHGCGRDPKVSLDLAGLAHQGKDEDTGETGHHSGKVNEQGREFPGSITQKLRRLSL